MKQLFLAIAVALTATSAGWCKDAPAGLSVLAFTSDSCQQDKAELERLRDEGVTVRIIEVDEQPELARRYNIHRLPSYVVEQNGVEVQRTEGPLTAAFIALLVWLFCS